MARRRQAGAEGGPTAAGTTSAPDTVATAGAALEDPVPAEPGQPALRWSSRADSIHGIQRELARIWTEPKLVATVDGVEERRIAARTSVMNLVVIALQPETGERAASTIARLAGRHPSRTLIVLARDPDGPNSLRAQIEAHCILPRRDAPETCSEMIHLQVGGPAGRHLGAVVAPLIIHDLPVTLWWPGETPFGSTSAEELFRMTDRLVVDGSSWGGDGLDRLRRMADLAENHGLAISDFALARQSRWREAIASVFDMPELTPYLRYVRRVAVTYAARDPATGPGTTNIVKPIYHVAWLASRLDMTVRQPVTLRPARRRVPGADAPVRVHAGVLGGPHGDVRVTIGPARSPLPAGTTLRVELLCDRRGSELRAGITAEAESVNVRAWRDGLMLFERSFLAPRRNDADLLEEAVEAGGRDPIAPATIRFAAEMVAPEGHGSAARPGNPRLDGAPARDREETVTGAAFDPGGAEVVVVPTARDVAGRSATLLIATLDAALRERGVAHVALTGGSSPPGVFRILASPRVRDRVDWSRVHLWWGDDRFVPRDDPLCNVWIADMALFRTEGGGPGIPSPADHVHPFPTTQAIEEGHDRDWCARQYEAELRRLVPVGEDGWPILDVVLVGIGSDGHLLSVFPGSEAFDSPAWALGIPAPTHVEPHVPRVTLNPAIVPAARTVLAMVPGAGKAAILETIFGPDRDPRRWPGQLALRPGATWVIDRAAAERLPQGPATAEADAEADAGRLDGTGGPMDEQCTHLDQIRDVTPSADGCEDCLRIGGRWVHLRMCLICGHVGCCDQSPNRHATAHFKQTGHPLIRSQEPGEDWGWCYVDLIDFPVG